MHTPFLGGLLSLESKWPWNIQLSHLLGPTGIHFWVGRWRSPPIWSCATCYLLGDGDESNKDLKKDAWCQVGFSDGARTSLIHANAP